MERKSYLVYDIEIRIAPPPRDGVRERNIKYVQSWNDHAAMGIACVGAFDCLTCTPRVFMRDNLGEFMALADSRDYLVGFNNARFDNEVLRCNGVNLPSEKTYDLLREIWRGAGLGEKFYSRTHGGYGLDAVCRANNLGSKSGDGANAATLWQRGKFGAVIDYCLNDVELTRRLLYLVDKGEGIKCPKTLTRLQVRKPTEPIPATTLFEI